MFMVTPRWTAATWWDVMTSLMLGQPVILWKTSEVCLAQTGRWLTRMGTLMAYLIRGQGTSTPALH